MTTTTVGGVLPPTITFDQMVAKYIALRDKTDAIKKVHQAELAKYNLALGTLEGWMLNVLNTNHAESMRAEAGTAYTSTIASAKVEDWDAVLEFVKVNDAWDLLEHRVSKLAAEAIIQETKQPIPGVSIDRSVRLYVRRVSDK